MGIVRCLGAAQLPPQSAIPPVSANEVASYLVQVAKALEQTRLLNVKYMVDGTRHVKTL